MTITSTRDPETARTTFPAKRLDAVDRAARRRRLVTVRHATFVVALLLPPVLATLAVVVVARAVPAPSGWIWLSLAAGVTTTYVAVQVAGTKLYHWNMSDNAQPRSVVVRLAMEIVAMTERAADIGRIPSAEAIRTAQTCEALVFQWRRRNLDTADRQHLLAEVDAASVEAMTRAHAELAPVVAPATPLSLRFAKYRRDNDVFPFLGQIQLVRQMMGVAVVGLLVLLALIQRTDFSGGPGAPQTVNIVVLLASSALGGAFYALSTSNRYVKSRTFDPSTQPAYWSRFVLGLVAGGLLATILPVTDVNAAQDGLSAGAFAPPVLALLGGFSAEVVRQILDRFVDVLRTVVQGRDRPSAPEPSTGQRFQ